MLLIAFVFGAFSLLALRLEFLWLSFILLACLLSFQLILLGLIFLRKPSARVCLDGIFYSGIAISSSLGAIVIGQLWKRFGFENVMLFSLSGMVALIFILAFMVIKEPVEN